MMDRNTRTHLFVALLIVFACILSVVLQKKPQNDLIRYKEKYLALKQSYVDLARSQSTMLESLLKNYPDMQKLMPEHKDLGKTEFSEAIRRRIIELRLKAEALETEK